MNFEKVVDQAVEDRYHKGVLAYLKTLIGDQNEGVENKVEGSPKVGQKRRFSRACINAIQKQEINSVEKAFLERPDSPNYRIHSDK